MLPINSMQGENTDLEEAVISDPIDERSPITLESNSFLVKSFENRPY